AADIAVPGNRPADALQTPCRRPADALRTPCGRPAAAPQRVADLANVNDISLTLERQGLSGHVRHGAEREGHARAERDAGPRVRLAGDRGRGVAGGVEARDRRPVRTAHGPVAIDHGP